MSRVGVGQSCSSVNPRRKNCLGLFDENQFCFDGDRRIKDPLRYLSPRPWSRWVKRFTELVLLGEADKVFKA